MSRPSLSPSTVNHGVQGWDTVIDDNHTEVADLVNDGPFPVHEHTGDQTDLESTFPAASHDRCLVWVDHTSEGWNLYMSNGSAWLRYPGKQVANQGDSSAADLPTMVSDFNSLLSKLKDAGVMAP